MLSTISHGWTRRRTPTHSQLTYYVDIRRFYICNSLAQNWIIFWTNHTRIYKSYFIFFKRDSYFFLKCYKNRWTKSLVSLHNIATIKSSFSNCEDTPERLKVKGILSVWKLRNRKLMSSPKYQKVETNSSDSQEELVEDRMDHVSSIPSTHSSQQLMSPDAESVLTEEDAKSISRRNRQAESSAGFGSVTSKEWFTVGVLCFINLINYMDRFTIAGECLRLSWFMLTSEWVNCMVVTNTPTRESFAKKLDDDKKKLFELKWQGLIGGV